MHIAKEKLNNRYLLYLYYNTNMKKIRLLSLLWIALLSSTLVACSPFSKEETNNGDIIIEDIDNNWVINYNNTLVDLAIQCIENEETIRTIYNSYMSWSTEELSSAINSAISTCNTVIDQINTLWDREWDSSMKNGVLVLIEKYITYYEKISKTLPFLENAENISDEEETQYKAIIDEIKAIDNEIEKANNNIASIQETFAETHNYDLEPTNEA